MRIQSVSEMPFRNFMFQGFGNYFCHNINGFEKKSFVSDIEQNQTFYEFINIHKWYDSASETKKRIQFRAPPKKQVPVLRYP